jgi:hypothetical protein
MGVWSDRNILQCIRSHLLSSAPSITPLIGLAAANVATTHTATAARIILLGIINHTVGPLLSMSNSIRCQCRNETGPRLGVTGITTVLAGDAIDESSLWLDWGRHADQSKQLRSGSSLLKLCLMCS